MTQELFDNIISFMHTKYKYLLNSKCFETYEHINLKVCISKLKLDFDQKFQEWALQVNAYLYLVDVPFTFLTITVTIWSKSFHFPDRGWYMLLLWRLSCLTGNHFFFSTTRGNVKKTWIFYSKSSIRSSASDTKQTY